LGRGALGTETAGIVGELLIQVVTIAGAAKVLGLGGLELGDGPTGNQRIVRGIAPLIDAPNPSNGVKIGVDGRDQLVKVVLFHVGQGENHPVPLVVAPFARPPVPVIGRIPNSARRRANGQGAVLSAGGEKPVDVVVVVTGETELLEVVGAAHATGRFAD